MDVRDVWRKMEMPLGIDAHYYNNLNIDGFSRMMKDPSYCYKFYWIEIKNAIKQYDKELHAEKQALTLNVPYKALSGFANQMGERKI